MPNIMNHIQTNRHTVGAKYNRSRSYIKYLMLNLHTFLLQVYTHRKMQIQYLLPKTPIGKGFSPKSETWLLNLFLAVVEAYNGLLNGY